MSVLSIISVLASILGVIIYGSLFQGSGLAPLFVAISLISVILPPIAKSVRITQGKKGKAFEIIAIIIGGFNFYCVIFALTTAPIFIAYLGWVASGIAYILLKEKRNGTSQSDSAEVHESLSQINNMSSEKCENEPQKSPTSIPIPVAPVPIAGNAVVTGTSDTSTIVVSEPSVRPADSQQIKFCRKCGFKLIDGSKFCSKCGNKIESEDEVRSL